MCSDNAAYGTLCGPNGEWYSSDKVLYMPEDPYVVAPSVFFDKANPTNGFNFYGAGPPPYPGPAWPTYGAPDGGGKLNWTQDMELCYAHRASDVYYSFSVAQLGLKPGQWYSFVVIGTESKWSHGFKKGGCGGCNGGIFEFFLNGNFIGRYDMVALMGLKGQWTELAIPFRIKAGQANVSLSISHISPDLSCPCQYPFSLCALRIHNTALPGSSMWDRTGGMWAWQPQIWQGSTWIYAVNVGGSYLQQPDGLLWSQDYGSRFPPNLAYSGDEDITYGTASITCGSDYNYPLACVPAYVGKNTSLRGIDPWVHNWGRKQEYLDMNSTKYGQRIYNLTFKLPVPTDGRYIVILLDHVVSGDGWPQSGTFFEIEFGRCNDEPGTGAIHKFGKSLCNTSYLEPCVGAFHVESRDKLITMHMAYKSSSGATCPMPSAYGDACWGDMGHHPGTRAILVKEDDGVIPAILAPNVESAYKSLTQSTCTSKLRGNYPNYEWLGEPIPGYVSDAMIPYYDATTPAPLSTPTPNPGTPGTHTSFGLQLLSSFLAVAIAAAVLFY